MNRTPRPSDLNRLEELVAILGAENKRLTAALLKYGGHKRHCRVNKKGLVFANCTCGWDARRAELEKQVKGDE